MSNHENSESTISQEIHRLQKMTVGDLQDEYLMRFGAESRSGNKSYLWKKLAYRIQEAKEGGLSPEAKSRAAILAPNTSIRVRLPREFSKKAEAEAKTQPLDPRLPPKGSVIKKVHEEEEYEITVLDDGFDYQGEHYRSLSAIAKEITGTSWNGFLFFGLEKRTRKKKGTRK